MDLFKIIGLGILISIVIVVTKQIKPELGIAVMLAGSTLMLIYILNSFTGIISSFNQIVNQTGINKELFSIIIKIIGVGYLIEFAADICKDSGNSAIADKVILGGKVLIFMLAMPIITSLFNIILELIN